MRALLLLLYVVDVVALTIGGIQADHLIKSEWSDSHTHTTELLCAVQIISNSKASIFASIGSIVLEVYLKIHESSCHPA